MTTPLPSPGLRPAAPPAGGTITDRFGRVATDLRVSVTDRCNLRCTYCMPAEGLPWLPKDSVLSDDELVRVLGVFVGLGVRSLRITGGEPLIRPGLTGLVERIAALRPRPRIALTTNGLGLARLAPALAAAGLDRVNVSLDTVDPAEFATLTRRDRLADVEAGLEAATDAGLAPVKVNAVAMRGVNDASIPDLLQWCLDRGYELRFIEQMPLDADHSWSAASLVSREEILDRLGQRFSLTPQPDGTRGSAPAESFLVDGGPATVGVIASVSAPFCAACDRVRLTADGMVRNCLFSMDESDLRGPLRAGASDEELADVIRGEQWRKWAGHHVGRSDFVQPERPMSSIGG